jgi:hypothetical protein
LLSTLPRRLTSPRPLPRLVSVLSPIYFPR